MKQLIQNLSRRRFWQAVVAGFLVLRGRPTTVSAAPLYQGSVPITNLDKFRVFFQIMDNICRLQANIRSNATTWKAMAQAQSPPLATLRTFMHDGAVAWQTRLGWVTTLRNDATKRQRVIDVLNAMGFSETDIIDKVNAMQSVADQLAAASLPTYASMITACDGILSTVDVAFSLWPE